MMTFECDGWEIFFISWIIITVAVFVGMWIVSDQISKDKSESSITYACGGMEYQEDEVKTMTLRDLTEHLQGLCHEGYSNEEVIAEIDGLETSITSIRRRLREAKDADGTHEEHKIVLGAEKKK